MSLIYKRQNFNDEAEACYELNIFHLRVQTVFQVHTRKNTKKDYLVVISHKKTRRTEEHKILIGILLMLNNTAFNPIYYIFILKSALN
jgi:hypothetical protein